MKNGDFVIAPVGCAEYLTAGRKYQLLDIRESKFGIKFSTIDNEGCKLTCFLQGCGHLNGQDWILATESEAFLKEVEIGYKTIKTLSGENLILGSELIDDSFNFVKFVTDTNSNSFEPIAILNTDNQIVDFLEKNGFESVEKGVYFNAKAKVILYDDYYAVLNFEDGGINYSENLNIYWLIGYLTYYNLIDKEYKI